MTEPTAAEALDDLWDEYDGLLADRRGSGFRAARKAARLAIEEAIRAEAGGELLALREALDDMVGWLVDVYWPHGQSPLAWAKRIDSASRVLNDTAPTAAAEVARIEKPWREFVVQMLQGTIQRYGPLDEREAAILRALLDKSSEGEK